MKHKQSVLLLLAILAAGAFGSCKKELDLDEETRLAVEKQQMLQQLDDLFYRAFDAPLEAEEEYDRYFKDELLRDGHNFLTDNDIRMRATFADLAIRLNVQFEGVKDGVSTESLFDIYRAAFENALFNRSLMGEIPQQLRRGDKLDRFEARAAEYKAFFDGKIRDFRAAHAPDPAAIGKQWRGERWIVSPSAFVQASFDFNLKPDGTADIDKFFPIPVRYMKGILQIKETTEILDNIKSALLMPMEHTFYNGKLFVKLGLEQSHDPSAPKGDREYCYEFDYGVEDGELTLSNPHVMLYMHPFLYVTGYGEDDYEENYYEDLRKPITLSIDN